MCSKHMRAHHEAGVQPSLKVTKSEYDRAFELVNDVLQAKAEAMIRHQANEASAGGYPNDCQAERLHRLEVRAGAEEDSEETGLQLPLSSIL